MFIFLPIILAAIYLEAVFTSLPLLLIVLIVVIVLEKKSWVAAAAFFGGVFSDAVSVRTIGTSSIFLLAWMFFILLYERKYEIDSLPFVCVSIFLGSLLYMRIIGARDILAAAFVGAIVGGALFWCFKFFYFNKIEKAKLRM